MRKSILLLFVLLLSMPSFLTGCWSRIELNDVAIITATAIDHVKDNKLQLTLQILKVKTTKGGSDKGGSGEGSTLIVSEKGESVMDAFSIIQKKLSRKLVFSHNRVVIVSEKLARSGLSPVLDFFSRYREARGNSYLLATKGEAKDVLKVPPNFEDLSAEEIREEEKARRLDSLSFREFVSRLLEKGIEPICTQIQAVPLDGQKSASPKEEGKGLGLVGAGIFHQDKLVGWMKRQDAETMSWMRNKLKDSTITVSMADHDKGDGIVSAQLFKAKTSIKPKIQGEKVKFDIVMSLTGELFENSTKLSIKEVKNLNKIQQAFEQEVVARGTSVVEKLQKQFKADALGFGMILHRKYKKAWNEKFVNRWDEEFPKVEIHIKAHFKIIGTGRANDSVIWEEEQLEK